MQNIRKKTFCSDYKFNINVKKEYIFVQRFLKE